MIAKIEVEPTMLRRLCRAETLSAAEVLKNASVDCREEK
jgi:hypothetical protein